MSFLINTWWGIIVLLVMIAATAILGKIAQKGNFSIVSMILFATSSSLMTVLCSALITEQTNVNGAGGLGIISGAIYLLLLIGSGKQSKGICK